MRLIITDRKLATIERRRLAEQLGYELSIFDYDGLSTTGIGVQLAHDNLRDNKAVVSADTRLLTFVGNGKVFQLDDVYLCEDTTLKPIRECTSRILRDSHNLMKLYESGEFEF